jgi:hypothetical protein
VGRQSESDRALDLLMTKYGDRAPYDVAWVHAWRGEHDRAFEWLQRAYDQHDLTLPGVKVSHGFRKLHGDPRFTALLRKLNLPVD